MDRYAFDTMKNGYNRYQVEDYIQTQKLQMESLQKKLEKANLLKEELTREYQELETRYRDVSENLEVKEKAADEMTRMAMKEANMIVDTAHRNADAIVKESLMMARGILMEVARLGDEANDLKGSMRKELQKITQALDDFETPEIPDLDLLKKENAEVDFFDPYIPEYRYFGKTYKGIEKIDPMILGEYDLIVIATAHKSYDLEMIQKSSKAIFDSRNAMKDIADKSNIELL